MRRHLRALEHDGGVDVDHPQPLAAHQGRHLAQQRDRVGAAPALVGVGEVLADVAQPGRPQQRVHDRVREDVGVGVAGQAQLVLDAHAAEDQRAALDQAVGVVAQADHHVAPIGSVRRSRRSKTVSSSTPTSSSISSARS